MNHPAPVPNSKLIVVSNRLPVSVSKVDGKLQYSPSTGGLATAMSSLGKERDMIWIHDYHFLLLPRLVRKVLPDSTIGFFLHIPFPSYEIFRLLPNRVELLKGLLGADLVGFHTYDYARYFSMSVLRGLGHENNLG